jgi:hypothetical protein
MDGPAAPQMLTDGSYNPAEIGLVHMEGRQWKACRYNSCMRNRSSSWKGRTVRRARRRVWETEEDDETLNLCQEWKEGYTLRCAAPRFYQM